MDHCGKSLENENADRNADNEGSTQEISEGNKDSLGN